MGVLVLSMLILIAGVFASSVLLTGVLVRIAPRLRLLDLPVSRSAHARPVPLGGGLSIVVLFGVVACYYFLKGVIPLPEFLALTGGVGVAIIGLIDDRNQLDAQWRVPLQFVAAAWSVWWLGDVPPIGIGIWSLQVPWLLNGMAIVALVWLLNLYNFMDGIDGLAASELVFVNLLASLFVITSDDLVLGLLSGTLLAAGAGFLVWNWAPAKIFLGDVGSGFIGFTLGILALLSMHHGSMTVWSWVIMLAIFIVDATITLFRRCLGGEKWFEGHASHAYQNAARQYKSHSKVTITVVLINCLWLAPLAWLSVSRPELGVYLALVALLPLVVLAVKLNAGKLTEVAFDPP